MRMVSKQAAEVLDTLTAGLAEGDARKIDNTDGTFMPVYVNRLYGNRYSVVHYYEQGGDLCPDPDMEFIRLGPGRWVPASITQWSGYRVAVKTDGAGQVTGYYPRTLADLLSFTTMWMRNIKMQQGGMRALRKAA